MAEQKIFAGPRLRRLRQARGLTQTAMAEGLGISASYLNLIERNQRPLTVQLILKLAAIYDVDARELQGEVAGSVAAMKEVFADPLLAAELPGDQELIDLAQSAPNAAAAMLKLYRAYREQSARLSDLGALMAREGREVVMNARLPIDEFRDSFELRPNHFDALDEAAEAFHASLDAGDDLAGALRRWLRREHGISVALLPAATMPLWRRRYDRHSQRLFVSERLSPFDQLQEVATEACLIHLRSTVMAQVEALRLSSDEARRLARLELGRYAALALMMPYRRFREAAMRARYDVDVVSARFGVSWEQAAGRMTTLGRAGSEGVPFFLLEVDGAGNRFRRAGSRGFPHARFGGACPKLPVYLALQQPGRTLAQAAEMPDGSRFLCVARALEGARASVSDHPRRTALLLVCEMQSAGQTVYEAALPPLPAAARVPDSASAAIGPACRICERTGCLARAEPPVTRPLVLDDRVSGLSVFGAG